jgi:hypothetical protein
MVSADVETPSWRLSPSPSLGLAGRYAAATGRALVAAIHLNVAVSHCIPPPKGRPAGERFLAEEEKKRPRPFWLPLSCSSSALMTEWSRAAAVASARANPEKTPGMLSRRGLAHACRRISETDAKHTVEVRAVREARAESDLAHLERSAGRVGQQPVRSTRRRSRTCS